MMVHEEVAYIEVEASMYCDGWPGVVAISDDVPGLCGHGGTVDEAQEHLAEQFESITWH